MHLFSGKQPFAVYRVPGEKYPRLLTEDVGAVRLIFDLKELNGQRGFVIAPFRVDKSCPIVLIQSDRTGQPLPRKSWQRKSRACKVIRRNLFIPFVLGSMRPVFIHLLKPCVMLPLINWCFPVVSLLERIRSFPLQLFFVQLVNVIFIPISICVILLRRACGWEVLPKLYCRAKKMNGTQLPWQELNLCRMDKLPQVWDDKNRQEQDYVASYIRRQLLSLGIRSTESGPYPAYAGALSHLKTDFHFSLKDNKNLGDLLKVLHPTPAVCGLPKEEAYRVHFGK